jgi:transcriptional regulator with XRE-family HTH domain
MHQDELIRALKERRETLGLTQERLAELAGIGSRTLKAIESNKGNPTFTTLDKIADVLGMEVKLKIKQLNSNN